MPSRTEAILSESDRFIWQPKVMMWYFIWLYYNRKGGVSTIDSGVDLDYELNSQAVVWRSVEKNDKRNTN